MNRHHGWSLDLKQGLTRATEAAEMDWRTNHGGGGGQRAEGRGGLDELLRVSNCERDNQPTTTTTSY